MRFNMLKPSTYFRGGVMIVAINDNLHRLTGRYESTMY